MAKLRITQDEISIDGANVPLKWLGSIKYDEETPGKGVLTLKYHTNGIELIDVDSLKRVEVVETVESSQATKKLRHDLLENAAEEIDKYLEADGDKETSEWHLKNAILLIKDAIKF